MASPIFKLNKPFKVFKGAPLTIPDSNSLEGLVEWLNSQEHPQGAPSEYNSLFDIYTYVNTYFKQYAGGRNLRDIASWAGAWTIGKLDNNIVAVVMQESEEGRVMWYVSANAVTFVASDVTVRIACQIPENEYDGIYITVFTDVVIPKGEMYGRALVDWDDPREIEADRTYIESITPAEDDQYFYLNGSPKGA